ncbi:MAG: hypothetical protein M3N30_06600 [Bacteroidota bacterium]|nr:hypothetical protein [Bacteroidota bacterium]
MVKNKHPALVSEALFMKANGVISQNPHSGISKKFKTEAFPVEEFIKFKPFQIYFSDSETDLIAIPNLFIITDINKLTNETFDYINGFVEERLFDDEMIISYTGPKTELSIKNSNYFVINLNLSMQDLEAILIERVLIRKKSFRSIVCC